ncbi:MAG: DUF2779 domain-containing protein [Bacteriovorax sp.]|nr:DUF2779 domain-containing protein [Bacteriovorax sp.]
MKYIAKYDYIKFKQCPRLFAYNWLDIRPSAGEIDPLKDFLTLQGIEVGILAKDLFKNRATYNVNQKNVTLAFIETKEALGSVDVIFEGAFEYEGLITRPDILNFKDNELVEIKSTTEVKDDHILDIAFQKYLLEKCGVKINKVKIGHINKQYVFDGTLDLNDFFIFTDVTEIISHKILELENDLLIINDIIKNGVLPERLIGSHCNSESGCPYKKDCWDEATLDSIFNLRRDVSGKKFDLHREGIKQLKDIPSYVTLTNFQKLQKEAEIHSCAIVNHFAIAEAIHEVVYPIYFLDFEAFIQAIPRYPKTTPYQQIPFQASIHRLKGQGLKLKHFSFLNIDDTDPRLALSKFLIKSLEEYGSIIAYHASYEKGRLYELIKSAPQYEKELLALIDRIWDLEEIFNKGMYVHPDFQGSTSIKKVLPVICPKLSYDDLGINNGTLASVQYLKMISKDTSKEKKEKIKNDLEAYCSLDTFAMYSIFKKISELI